MASNPAPAPAPQKYYTVDGLPPNGGVPFNRMFFIADPPTYSESTTTTVALATRSQGHNPSSPQQQPPPLPPQPPKFYTADNKPPNNGLPLRELSDEERIKLLATVIEQLQLCKPPASTPQAVQKTQTPPPPPPPAAATSTITTSTTAGDPLSLVHNSILHLFPENHITLRFLYDGQRPCDHYPGLWTEKFAFQRVKVPVSMTVGELVRRLLGVGVGVGGTTGRGVQEMVEVICPLRQGTVFAPGQILSEQGPWTAKTLGEIGWDERHHHHRDERNPIWVVLAAV